MTKNEEKKMKVLVTGVTGQLGFDVMGELKRRGIECLGAGHADFSLTDFAATRNFIDAYGPDVVVHCAAYTAVDKAENEPELCAAVNDAAVRNIAGVCRDNRAKLVYISTDYVFSGEGTEFYVPEAPKAPQNVYGRTKLAGERAVQEILKEYFIVRISWVFGKNGKNFIKTMLQLGETHKALTIVDDQVGSPTYTVDLANLLVDLAATEKYGVYHATNEGVCSWAEFAREVFYQAGLNVKVTGVPSSAYPTQAVRPHNSRLSKKCLAAAGFVRLPVWQDAVRRYLQEIGR